MFEKKTFDVSFKKSLRKVTGAEKIVRAELAILSRTVLEAVHASGDIGYVNQLIAVLSPVNKKVARIYFKYFTGFSFDEVSNLFSKKSKKRYDEAHRAAMTLLEDPNQNIWTWAERHIEVEPKAFKIEKVSEYFTRALKQGAAAGVSQVEIMRAIIKCGVTADTIITCMTDLGFDVVDETENKIDPAPEKKMEDAPY